MGVNSARSLPSLNPVLAGPGRSWPVLAGPGLCDKSGGGLAKETRVFEQKEGRRILTSPVCSAFVRCMVPVRYMGVERSRLMALKPFRDELLAIMSTYRPFHDDFKSVHAVVEAIDEMMERLAGDRDAFWRITEQLAGYTRSPRSPT